jgi:hypothetical protein
MRIGIFVIITTTSFCIIMTGVIMGNISINKMVGEINRKRKEDDHISSFGFFTPVKMELIFDEYRKFYPGGRLYKRMMLSIALTFFGLVPFGIYVFAMHFYPILFPQ